MSKNLYFRLDKIMVLITNGATRKATTFEIQIGINNNYLSYFVVFQCLGAFPHHSQDHYRGVLQYTLTGVTPRRRLYVVSCPISPYW